MLLMGAVMFYTEDASSASALVKEPEENSIDDALTHADLDDFTSAGSVAPEAKEDSSKKLSTNDFLESIVAPGEKEKQLKPQDALLHGVKAALRSAPAHPDSVEVETSATKYTNVVAKHFHTKWVGLPKKVANEKVYKSTLGPFDQYKIWKAKARKHGGKAFKAAAKACRIARVASYTKCGKVYCSTMKKCSSPCPTHAYKMPPIQVVPMQRGSQRPFYMVQEVFNKENHAKEVVSKEKFRKEQAVKEKAYKARAKIEKAGKESALKESVVKEKAFKVKDKHEHSAKAAERTAKEKAAKEAAAKEKVKKEKAAKVITAEKVKKAEMVKEKAAEDRALLKCNARAAKVLKTCEAKKAAGAPIAVKEKEHKVKVASKAVAAALKAYVAAKGTKKSNAATKTLAAAREALAKATHDAAVEVAKASNATAKAATAAKAAVNAVAARQDSQLGVLNSSSTLAKKALSAAAHTANKTLSSATKTLSTLELLTLDDGTLTKAEVSAQDMTSHNLTAAAVAAATVANKLQAKVKATAAKVNQTVAKQTVQVAASKDDKKVASVQGAYIRSHSGKAHMKTCEDQRKFAFDKCFGRATYKGQVLASGKAKESRTKAAALEAKQGTLKTALVHAKKAAAAAAKAANSTKTFEELQYPTFAGLDEEANGEDVSASVEEAPETTFTEVSAGKKESKACKKNIAGAYETCHRIVDKAYAQCAILYKNAAKGIVTAIATPPPATAPAAVKASPTTTGTGSGAAPLPAPSAASPTAAPVTAKTLAAASVASAPSTASAGSPSSPASSSASSASLPASSTSSPASAPTPTPTHFSTSLAPPPTPTPTLPPGVKPTTACIIVVPQHAKKGNCTSVLHAGKSCSFTCPKGTVLTGPTTCTQHPTGAVLNSGMCSPLTCDTKIGQWCPTGSSIVEASVCAAAAKLNNATFSVETVKASVRAPEGCFTETGTNHYTLNQNTRTLAPGNRAIVSICKCSLMGNATANQTAAAVAASIAEASEPESEPEDDGDGDGDGDSNDDGDGSSTSLLESPEPEPVFEED